MILYQLLITVVKLAAFAVGVVLMTGGVFRMSPHHASGRLYLNVVLIFLGSFVVLAGVFIS